MTQAQRVRVPRSFRQQQDRYAGGRFGHSGHFDSLDLDPLRLKIFVVGTMKINDAPARTQL